MTKIATIFDIDGTLVESSHFDGAYYISAIRDVLGEVCINDDWKKIKFGKRGKLRKSAKNSVN